MKESHLDKAKNQLLYKELTPEFKELITRLPVEGAQ